jgi:hypothetical protein
VGHAICAEHLPRLLKRLQHFAGERYGELRRIENRYNGSSTTTSCVTVAVLAMVS